MFEIHKSHNQKRNSKRKSSESDQLTAQSFISFTGKQHKTTKSSFSVRVVVCRSRLKTTPDWNCSTPTVPSEKFNKRLNCTQPKPSTHYFCSAQLQLLAWRLYTGRKRPIRGFFFFFNEFCSCLINFRFKKSSLGIQLHQPLQYMLMLLIHSMFFLMQPF